MVYYCDLRNNQCRLPNFCDVIAKIDVICLKTFFPWCPPYCSRLQDWAFSNKNILFVETARNEPVCIIPAYGCSPNVTISKRTTPNDQTSDLVLNKDCRKTSGAVHLISALTPSWISRSPCKMFGNTIYYNDNDDLSLSLFPPYSMYIVGILST